ncbi:hydrolase [Neobacillus mesonae]|uniref:Hydrolase n=1 Tax=Neobacillus mesonae TaxID=1193713 RepID=A0A3T0I4J4_9BACI|nr:hydrolase [Neobacillus mesonae]AZU64294.1 hydrolase [Neobacillus mesonae]MED4203625.1 hydrolase [Neobacillus mesonae]
MEQPKQSYYINIQSHEIAWDPFISDWDFKIEATDSQIADLKQLFDENYQTDWESFIRSHVPFLEYHHDPQNTEYDMRMVVIYAMLYQLGDSRTRTHIEEMGILNEDFLNRQNAQFK